MSDRTVHENVTRCDHLGSFRHEHKGPVADVFKTAFSPTILGYRVAYVATYDHNIITGPLVT